MRGELTLVGAIIGAVVLVVLWRLLRRKPKQSWIETATCPACGWRGQTSRYAGRCPSCNAPLGEQRARRPR